MQEQELKTMLMPVVTSSLARTANMQETIDTAAAAVRDETRRITEELEALVRRIDILGRQLAREAAPQAVVATDPPSAVGDDLLSAGVGGMPRLSVERPAEERAIYEVLWEHRHDILKATPEGDHRSGPLGGPLRGYVPRALFEIVGETCNADKPTSRATLLAAAQQRVWKEKVLGAFERGQVVPDGEGWWKSKDPYMSTMLAVAGTLIHQRETGS